MGVDYENDPRIVEVYNKIDALDKEALEEFTRESKISRGISKILISAQNGIGLDDLLEKVAEITSRDNQNVSYEIPFTDGKAISWLYERGDVIEREDRENGMLLTLNLSKTNISQFEKKFGYKSS